MNFIGVDLTPITLTAYEPTAFCVLKKDGKGLPVLAECLTVPEPNSKAQRLLAEVYAEPPGEGRMAMMSRLVSQVDQELVELIVEFMPGIVGINAALSLPSGRAGYEARLTDHILDQDPLLKEVRTRLRAPSQEPARTFRGLAIRDLLDREGLVYGEDVIEVCPRATLAYLSLPTTVAEGPMAFQDLPERLLKLLTIPKSSRLPQSWGEYAALLAAFTCYLRYIGVTEEVGDRGEGTITLPRRADHAGSH